MDTAHRHAWSVVDFGLTDGRPIMRQACACGATRTVPAWDRSWTPPEPTTSAPPPPTSEAPNTEGKALKALRGGSKRQGLDGYAIGSCLLRNVT